MRESCSDCDWVPPSTFHDVYFRRPYWEEQIGPEPVFIESRAQKAHLLKDRGLREAGDRVHGSNGLDRISHQTAIKNGQKEK